MDSLAIVAIAVVVAFVVYEYRLGKLGKIVASLQPKVEPTVSAPAPAWVIPAAFTAPAPVVAPVSPQFAIDPISPVAPVVAPAPKFVFVRGMTPAERDAQANKIGPGIADDVSKLDPSAMSFVSQVIYRQVDNPAESIAASIKFVRDNLTDVRGEKIASVVEPDCVGPVPVSSLDEADKFFLWRHLRDPGYADWPYAVLSGTRAQVREAMSWADGGPGAAAALQFDRESYTGKLKQYE